MSVTRPIAGKGTIDNIRISKTYRPEINVFCEKWSHYTVVSQRFHSITFLISDFMDIGEPSDHFNIKINYQNRNIISKDTRVYTLNTYAFARSQLLKK